MSKIQLDADCYGAVCKILQGSDSILVQTDYDAPGVASTFGWDISQVGSSNCRHRGTDGTIDCKECGTTASAFIAAAIDFINDHDGDEVDDPGYFTEG